MNPADDHNIPYLEILGDNRRRYSWILWGPNNEPICLSSLTFDNPMECAQHLKKTRKAIKNAPTIIYTSRKAAPSGRYTKKHWADLDDGTPEA